MKHYIYLLTGLVFLAGLLAETHAIPAFARKYSMSCKTCHAPAPKLKDYGEEFAANGFELKDKEAPRYYQDTGDDQVSLIRDFPLAIHGHLAVPAKGRPQRVSDRNVTRSVKHSRTLTLSSI